MKTFSKILSLILVGVMCFGLFATSAFAFSLDGSGDFSLDGSSSDSFSGSDNSANFNWNDSSDGFNLNGSSDGFSVDSSFQDNLYAGQTQNDENSFSVDTPPVADAQPTFVVDDKDDEESFTLEEVDMFGEPYKPGMTFSQDKTSIKVTDTDAAATVKFSCSGGTLDADTFKRITYSTSPSGEGRQNVPASGFTIQTGTLTIQGTWLKTLNAGNTYYFYGERTDELPIKLGFIAVNAGAAGDYGTFEVKNSPYIRYGTKADGSDVNLVKIVATTGSFDQFTRYAVIRQGSSTGGKYCDEYTITNSNKTFTFNKSFLLALDNGNYDIYGITSQGINVKLGSMTISRSDGGGSFDGSTWTLYPSYYSTWSTGDDYLFFVSNLMAVRHEYPNRVVVVRYGYGANSIPDKQVDVNQYYDLSQSKGPGTFALGINFLSSLSSGTYTLQVVDIKNWDCTNIVTFRIGSTLRAIDTDKHVIGSIKNLRFLCDEAIEEVYVGNIPLTYGEDYALSNGNRTVTLSFEFLNRRSAGYDYTIKVKTVSGDYPSCTFHILSSAQGTASPRTGDESNLGLWAAFLLLSGTAIVVLIPKLRKSNF